MLCVLVLFEFRQAVINHYKEKKKHLIEHLKQNQCIVLVFFFSKSNPVLSDAQNNDEIKVCKACSLIF